MGRKGEENGVGKGEKGRKKRQKYEKKEGKKREKKREKNSQSHGRRGMRINWNFCLTWNVKPKKTLEEKRIFPFLF